ERLVSHHRPKVGTADSDIEDVSYTLTRVALPLAIPHAVGKAAHLPENSVDFGNDIHAVNNDRGALGCPESNMQYGSILGDIDFLAAKHGIDPHSQARLV